MVARPTSLCTWTLCLPSTTICTDFDTVLGLLPSDSYTTDKPHFFVYYQYYYEYLLGIRTGKCARHISLIGILRLSPKVEPTVLLQYRHAQLPRRDSRSFDGSPGILWLAALSTFVKLAPLRTADSPYTALQTPKRLSRLSPVASPEAAVGFRTGAY